MVEKTDKGSKLDGETKKIFKEIENREKSVDKKGFMKYFNCEPTALQLYSLDEIKQQRIELNKDERNSTNYKNENDRLNMILSVIDRIYQFFEYKFLLREQLNKINLPKWVNVSIKRFNEILSIITKAKNNGLEVNVDGTEITLDNAERILKVIASGKIDSSEFKRECNNMVDDVKAIPQKPMFRRSQEKMVEALSLLKEIPKPNDEQPDTTGMSELESEESAAQRRNHPGQGLKILTPDQMLIRLPITLAQLIAGITSEKLKIEIRQLLYSLYRSKKLTKQLYKSLIDII